MSCIVGISSNGVVYIGADTISIAGNELRSRGDPKVFQNGNYLIGYSGSVRPGQVLTPRYWKPPRDIYGFPDEIRSHLELKGCLQKNEQGEDELGTNFIIGFNGNLYEIQTDFQLAEYGDDNYTSIGVGAQYALGSLYETKDLDFSPELRIRHAINASILFSPACGGEILILRIP